MSWEAGSGANWTVGSEAVWETIVSEWEHAHHDDEVEAVTVGSTVYSSGRLSDIIAVRQSNGTILWDKIDENISLIRDVSVAGDRLLISGTGNRVKSLDKDDGSIQWEHSHHNASVYEVVASPDKTFSGDADGVVIAADITDGGKIWNHTHHESGDQIRSVYYDADEPVVLSTGFDDHIIGASPDDGSEIFNYDRSRSMKSVDKMDNLVFLGLWSSTPDVKVEAIDWETQDLIWSHEGHASDSSGVNEIHANAGMVASAGADGRVVVADAETGNIIDTHDKHTDDVRSVHIKNDFVVSGSRDGLVIKHRIEPF